MNDQLAVQREAFADWLADRIWQLPLPRAGALSGAERDELTRFYLDLKARPEGADMRLGADGWLTLSAVGLVASSGKGMRVLCRNWIIQARRVRA